MKYSELDRSQKYADGRMYFIEHKGKFIHVSDYSNLSGQEYMDAINKMRDWLVSLGIEGKEIINLVDFTNTKASTEVIENLKKSAAVFTKPHVRKTAVIGLTGLQKIFISAFSALGLSDLKPFSDKEAALDWLVAD